MRIAIHGSDKQVDNWVDTRRSNAVKTPKRDGAAAFEDLFFPLPKDDQNG